MMKVLEIGWVRRVCLWSGSILRQFQLTTVEFPYKDTQTLISKDNFNRNRCFFFQTKKKEREKNHKLIIHATPYTATNKKSVMHHSV